MGPGRVDIATPAERADAAGVAFTVARARADVYIGTLFECASRIWTEPLEVPHALSPELSR